jgi:hypothetical protein
VLPVPTWLQDRDTALRGLPGKPYPRCHFFSTFFLNKLYKDEKRYNYKNVSWLLLSTQYTRLVKQRQLAVAVVAW